VLSFRPSPAVPPSASPLEERRERMQAEEGKGASSRQRAAAAASTRAVGSPAWREPRRPRQEVRRAATCAGEEVRGGRGGGGKEGGRGRPDLSGKGSAGTPRLGGRRSRRGGFRPLEEAAEERELAAC
jgi:hypothetical protein